METVVVTLEDAVGLFPQNACPYRIFTDNESNVFLALQMAGRHTWGHRTPERSLELCSPALKYVTCLQSLPWPKS
jgi:hypothetical protein